jgi:hypothetical protein
LRFHTRSADLNAGINQALNDDLSHFWRICDCRQKVCFWARGGEAAVQDEFASWLVRRRRQSIEKKTPPDGWDSKGGVTWSR